MPAIPLLAATETVQHRITSGLLEGFSQWWQGPAFVLVVLLLAAVSLAIYRRDAAELSRGVAALLVALRLGALAALVAAYLDLRRTAEHEILYPSRVAILVDSSASMTLEDAPRDGDPAGGAPVAASRSRAIEAADLLEAGGLLAALAARHEVALWRFDADAESVALLPGPEARGTGAAPSAGTAPEVTATGADATTGRHASGEPGAWRAKVAPLGFETRLGEALTAVLEQEPGESLAGVIVLTDGASNGGLDPAAAAAALARARIAVHPLGIGADRLPANVRVADVLAPSRVFPGDRFAVSAFLQAQGLEGTPVRVELLEAAADPAAGNAVSPAVGNAGVPDATAAEQGRVVDVVEVRLPADGELAGVRFDLPGLEAPGRRRLTVRVVPPTADRNRVDDLQSAEVEVVDRVTQVLLVAGGPTRDYQFMRNILQRDKSFAVDVLLATARRGASQDARRILEAFPATAEELSTYDAIVAFDVDWRSLDPAAQTRLERWVARESGGLFLVAGGVSMDAWLADPACGPLRTLLPVEPRRAGQLIVEEPGGFTEPRPLVFTRDGLDAEFLWLGGSRAASEAAWREFPGVYSCFDARSAKPGATVYATIGSAGDTARGDGSIYMAGQLYGAGTVFHLGSGELWRLRSLDETLYERLVTQLVRHVSQGRLLAGSRRARLLVDRERYAVGAGVVVRVVAADGESTLGAGPPECRVVGPDGATVRVPLAAEPGRPGVLQGMFVAGREGGWRIDVTLPAEAGREGETLSRRIQARLPDRELERPRLDRGSLEQVAAITGGTAAFLADSGWDAERSRALAARIPDRSRREYETGAPDGDFKRRLNTLLLGLGVGLLCAEWILRRLVRLA
ncbi:MAG: hypothetical protein EBR86_03080 [Planctomycetia bacterium]|nr:hypothetical protein [Planctomycetia bacterium]